MLRSEIAKGDTVWFRGRGGVVYKVKITYKGHLRARIEFEDGFERSCEYSSLHATEEECYE